MDNQIEQVLASLSNSALFKFSDLKRILGYDDITLLKKIVHRYLNCVSSVTEIVMLEGTILSVPSQSKTTCKTSTSKKD